VISLQQIEDMLADLFKGFPKLSKSSRDTLVGVWPWLALVLGIMQLFAAWALWGMLKTSDSIIGTYSSFYVNYPDAINGFDRLMVYMGIGVLVVDGVVLLKAYPALKKRLMMGWRLVFLGSLLNVAYAVVSLFILGRGVTSFIMSTVGSGVGLYLLFQVRGAYGAVKAAKKKT
jgi:hypothetical protein